MSVRRIVPNLVGDPAVARSFYEGVIGLELAMDLGWISTFAAADRPGVELSVLARDETAPAVPDVSIEVEDVDAVHVRVIAAGCEIVHPLTDEDWGVRRFFVRDPNGAVINVLQHIGR